MKYKSVGGKGPIFAQGEKTLLLSVLAYLDHPITEGGRNDALAAATRQLRDTDECSEAEANSFGAALQLNLIG